MKSVTDYLASIDAALRKGDATEHTHRPALKALLESMAPKITATNEPKRIACGAPDFVVSRNDLPLGYVEAKDVGFSLDDALRSDQLKRYVSSLDNLILTDYLEFRWFTEGQPRGKVRLADVLPSRRLGKPRDTAGDLRILMTSFLDHAPVTIS